MKLLISTAHRSSYKLYSEVGQSPVVFISPTYNRPERSDGSYYSVCHVSLTYLNPSYADEPIRMTDWTKVNLSYRLVESQ